MDRVLIIREFLLWIAAVSIMWFGNQMIFDDSKLWMLNFSFSCLGFMLATFIVYYMMILAEFWEEDPKPWELVCKPFFIASMGCGFTGTMMVFYSISLARAAAV